MGPSAERRRRGGGRRQREVSLELVQRREGRDEGMRHRASQRNVEQVRSLGRKRRQTDSINHGRIGTNQTREYRDQTKRERERREETERERKARRVGLEAWRLVGFDEAPSFFFFCLHICGGVPSLDLRLRGEEIERTAEGYWG